MIKIETASIELHTQLELDKLYQTIIKGYELTEEEVWGPNYVRVFKPDFDQLVLQKSVLIAFYNGAVAGGVYHYSKNKLEYTFSLLATDFSLGGRGIGKALIDRIEEIAIRKGAKQIKIEILRVRGADTVSKLRLAKFYDKLGYQYSHSEDCSCLIYPEKYKKLKAPSDFDFYLKQL